MPNSKPQTRKRTLIPSEYFPVSVKASLQKLTNTRILSPSLNAESVDALLETLVAFPTVTSDIAANRGAIKYIQRFLKAVGMHTEYHELNGYPALWATTQANQKHPKILMAGHIDVVTAPKPLFRLRKDGDRYYGRGTLDMKSAIAAYLKTIYELRHQLHHYDFGIAITSDEETAGLESGVYHLLEKGYSTDFAILPDGGDRWKFEMSCKGLIHVKLEAYGKAAHASRPWLGENALDKVSVLLNELRSQFPEQGPLTNTINVGIIQGGEVYNRIPSYVSAEVDIRTIDEKSTLRLMKLIEKSCAKYDIKCTVEGLFMPLQHSMDNEYMKAFLAMAEQVRKAPTETMMSFGGSDARFFVQRDIPVTVFYPEGGDHHSDKEWISIKALHEMEEIFTRFLREHAKIA